MAKPTSWKKLSQTVLLEHPRLTVVEDAVELPSGHKTHYLHFTNAVDAVCIVVVNKDSKFLIQKEYSYPSSEWLYQFPGGAVEEAEPIEQAAKRELAEEASLSGSLDKIGWFYPDNRRRTSKMHVFLATNLTADATAQQDVEEVFEDHWFSEKQIDAMIQSGEIVNYSTLAAWAFFKTRAQKQSVLH